MPADFDVILAEPHDFTAEIGCWAWFEASDESFLDSPTLLADLPTDIFVRLDGHDDSDPSTESMKLYPMRKSAMDALMRALDRVRGGAFVEPVEVIE